MNKVETTKEIKDFIEFNASEIAKLETDNKEVYDVFAKLLLVVDKKYGSGTLEEKELQEKVKKVAIVKEVDKFADSPKQTENKNAVVSNSINYRSNWRPDWKSVKGLRPSPQRSAKGESVGEIGVGFDGKAYEIKEDKNGTRSWKVSRGFVMENFNNMRLLSLEDLYVYLDQANSDLQQFIEHGDKDLISESERIVENIKKVIKEK